MRSFGLKKIIDDLIVCTDFVYLLLFIVLDRIYLEAINLIVSILLITFKLVLSFSHKKMNKTRNRIYQQSASRVDPSVIAK